MIYLIVTLAISIFANVAFGLGYLDQRDNMTKATANLKTAQASAESCSKDVERLGTLAASRLVEAENSRIAAKASAQSRNQRADKIMSTPASVAGDDCKSASDRAATWLAGRVGQPGGPQPGLPAGKDAP